MKIKTGKGTVSLAVLLAIWSVSALTSLPGLAVSPILGKISQLFPGAGELDIQMLTSLPSLLIIPFVLLAGRLTERVGYFRLLVVGLLLFTLCALLYLFADELWQLELISALMGVGAGLIIPLSTGLISIYFAGRYRTAQFGYASAVTNVTLVAATVAAGYLAEVEWHLPFLVYLLSVVPLVLVQSLKKMPAVASPSDGDGVGQGSRGIEVGALVRIMLFYLLITYLVLVVSFNLPFLMEQYGFDSGAPGLLIALFFLAIMLPGFFLNAVARRMGRNWPLCCLLMVAVGLFLVVVSRSAVLMGAGCLVCGFGYGVAQPLIYDKTTRVAVPQKSTLALAWVMAVNYVAILACPLVVDAAQSVCGVKSQTFAFWLNIAVAMLALLFVALMNRRKTYDR